MKRASNGLDMILVAQMDVSSHDLPIQSASTLQPVKPCCQMSPTQHTNVVALRNEECSSDKSRICEWFRVLNSIFDSVKSHCFNVVCLPLRP